MLSEICKLARKNLEDLALSSACARDALDQSSGDFGQTLVNLISISPPMLDSLRLHPEWLQLLNQRLDCPKTATDAARGFEEAWNEWTNAPALPPSGGMESLREFKRRELLEIAYCDISGIRTYEETVGRLSSLADCVIRKSLELVWKQLLEDDFTRSDSPRVFEGFCIYALGKLGGNELNYSSDVDLLFCRQPSDSPEESRFFMRLGERLIHALSAQGRDGFLYRVDMRLRPHGETGPLVPTTTNLLNYYESWGETWERQALIKLRHVAGDKSLGRRFEEFASQYIFARQMDDSALEEIKRVKHRSEKEYSIARNKIHIKQGPGGIRDIEFYTQYLQLIAGCRHPGVRTGNTLTAIRALSDARALLEGEESQLSLAYLFHRIVEHYLQLRALTPNSVLPEDPLQLASLASALGFGEDETAAPALLGTVNAYRKRVRSILERIYLAPGNLRLHEDQEIFAQLLTERTPRERIREILSRYGFQDIEKAWQNIRLIALGPEGRFLPPGERRIFLEYALQLLDVIGRTFDPDQALHHLESFAAASGNRLSLLRTLASRPPHLMRLSNLLSLSNLSREILERHPEYFDSLARGIHLQEGRRWDEMHNELNDRSGLSPRGESKDLLLRRYRQREMIRIAYRDIAGLADALEVSRELSDLARACTQLALDITRPPHGTFDESQNDVLIAVALGKFGSRQMHYASDLDLMFLYDAPASLSTPELRAGFQSARDEQVERLLELLSGVTAEGVVYSVDLRLRPEGASGLLARSWESFADYARKFMQPWERMALVRSRIIAPVESAARWNDVVAEVVYNHDWDEESLEAIRHIKRRIETEKNRSDRFSVDFKYGPGGITDLEFLVQFLQILYGPSHQDVRVPDLSEALPALRAAGALTGQEVEGLIGAHRFQRLVENHYQLMEGWGMREISRESPKLIRLARSLGFQAETPTDARKAFMTAWEENARRVRSVFEKYFYSKAR